MADSHRSEYNLQEYMVAQPLNTRRKRAKEVITPQRVTENQMASENISNFVKSTSESRRHNYTNRLHLGHHVLPEDYA